MTWFRVDDSFYDHPKVAELKPAEWGNALAIWLAAGTWCARHLTDGVIPIHVLERISPLGRKATRSAVAALARVSLWSIDGDRATFHEWSAWQPTRADVEHRREQVRERVANSRTRKNPEKPANGNAVTGGVTNAGCNAAPVPTRPDQIQIPNREEELPTPPPELSRGGYRWDHRRANGSLTAKVFRRLWESATGDAWDGPTQCAGSPPDAIDRWAETEGMRAFCTAEEVLECAILRWSEDEWRTEKRWPWPSFAKRYVECWRPEDLARRFPDRHGRDPLRKVVA